MQDLIHNYSCRDEVQKLRIPGGKEVRRALRQYVERVEEDHLLQSLMATLPTPPDWETSLPVGNPDFPSGRPTFPDTAASESTFPGIHPSGQPISWGKYTLDPQSPRPRLRSDADPSEASFFARAERGSASSSDAEAEIDAPPVFFLNYGLHQLQSHFDDIDG